MKEHKGSENNAQASAGPEKDASKAMAMVLPAFQISMLTVDASLFSCTATKQ
jgi:hypothetical protein